MGIVCKIAADIIKKIADDRNIDIGIFLVIHTFGRDLKRNYHIHLSVTLHGICKDKKKIKKIYFDHQLLKNKWKYCITNFLRKRYKSGNLNLPKSWHSFNSILNENYKKQWVVHLGKPCKHEKNIKKAVLRFEKGLHFKNQSITMHFFDQYLNFLTFMMFEYLTFYIFIYL